MKESGIYKITCLCNNKIYIGPAVNFSKRKTSGGFAWKYENNSNNI